MYIAIITFAICHFGTQEIATRKVASRISKSRKSLKIKITESKADFMIIPFWVNPMKFQTSHEPLKLQRHQCDERQCNGEKTQRASQRTPIRFGFVIFFCCLLLTQGELINRRAVVYNNIVPQSMVNTSQFSFGLCGGRFLAARLV